MATLSTAAKNAALNGIVAFLNTGATFAAPLGAFYIGGSSVTSGGFVQWSPASGGEAELTAAVTFSQSGITGTANFFRVFSRAADQTIVAGVGGPGSGAEIEIAPSAAIATGTRVRLLSLTLTIG